MQSSWYQNMATYHHSSGVWKIYIGRSKVLYFYIISLKQIEIHLILVSLYSHSYGIIFHMQAIFWCTKNHKIFMAESSSVVSLNNNFIDAWMEIEMLFSTYIKMSFYWISLMKRIYVHYTTFSRHKIYEGKNKGLK